MTTYFIAGTDTDVGKTLVSVALLHKANKAGLKTLALKPVAAGCYRAEKSGEAPLLNDDALSLQGEMSVDLPYSMVNPIALEPAIAPHIAAQQQNISLTANKLIEACALALETATHDIVLIEGAGGWRVPLNDNETLAQLAQGMTTHVVLVVGLRLGCINHALLTAEAIQRDGMNIVGWVANQVDPNMMEVDANINTLISQLNAPYWGHIPFLSKPEAANAARFLDIDKGLLDSLFNNK